MRLDLGGLRRLTRVASGDRLKRLKSVIGAALAGRKKASSRQAAPPAAPPLTPLGLVQEGGQFRCHYAAPSRPLAEVLADVADRFQYAPAVKPIPLFITVDTEELYFDRPHQITGEGVPSAKAIGHVMDRLESIGGRAVFFVNVYSHLDTASRRAEMERIVKDIHGRGHAVELHTHPWEGLDWYSRAIYHYPLDRQRHILEVGKRVLMEWIGREPIAHRGGVYSANDDTLTALAELGFKIDSSVLLDNPNNRFERFTVNAVRWRGGVVEVPVTSVVYQSEGKSWPAKLDINQLSFPEMMSVVRSAKAMNMPCLNLIMHSFSFMKKRSKRCSEPHVANALLRSPERANWYCEIFGPDNRALSAFDNFMQAVADDPGLCISTFDRAYEHLVAEASLERRDGVPLVLAERG